MEIKEIQNYLSTKEGMRLTRLGFEKYLAQGEPVTYTDPANWLEFGGKDGREVSLAKMPVFLGKEKARLDEQYKRYLKDDNVPQLFFINIIVDLAILKEAEDFNSPFGKAAAARYFLRRYLSEWYRYKYDPSLAMADLDKQQPVSASSANWSIYQSSLNALYLL